MAADAAAGPLPQAAAAQLRIHADPAGAVAHQERRQLGRIWTVLFLSEKPLAAPELCADLWARAERAVTAALSARNAAAGASAR